MLATLFLGFFNPSLDAILDDTKLKGAAVSAYVCRADGTPVYSRNSSLHVVPASNQKLLSAAFALHTLGPEWRPKTEIWKEPNRTFVQTTGDPLLSYGQLIWARQSLHLNPKLSVFVRQPYAPGIPPTWEHDDLPNRYAAPVTAFTVDRGSFELWFRDGKVTGFPNNYNLRILRGRNEGAISVEYDPFTKIAVVHGKLPVRNQRLDTLALLHPDREAAFLLGSGFTSTIAAPPTRTPDMTIFGSSVQRLLQRCLPPSDNNIAEHLLMLAASKEGTLPPAAYPAATRRLKDFLTGTVGLDAADIKPYDGSGMSRHNYVTTRALAELLRWANRQPTAQIWKSSLAISGQPGTLANRLKGVQFGGKTGTLDMVVALSGYVRHKSGEELIASVVLNQYGCTSAEARNLADDFVKEVSDLDLAATEGG